MANPMTRMPGGSDIMYGYLTVGPDDINSFVFDGGEQHGSTLRLIRLSLIAAHMDEFEQRKHVYRTLENRDDVETVDFTRDGYQAIIVDTSDPSNLDIATEAGYTCQSNGTDSNRFVLRWSPQ